MLKEIQNLLPGHPWADRIHYFDTITSTNTYAKELAEKCEDPQRKAELIQISENLKNVPANPAKTFWEAL